ncbi:NACHT, LRR and PYD domains-containing protein 5-like isoform X4 [Colossoma macropomum]|uniref:NACHT, LRR and PYD domains-containing protein 5-like isoform X4 n=1 Tax=Colossoma macropomum TaxID=42526 RepID=UPI0018646149|nr:NACHT, LRR and PYD domains-containing protein 5-like isoform X4 [Colossoma macropomum]
MAGQYGKASEMSLQEERSESKSGAEERSGSPVSSCVSFKSDQSMVEPHNFKGGSAPQKSGAEERSGSPVSSCVSMKSDQSMVEPHNFNGGSAPQKSGAEERSGSPVSSCVSFKSDQSMVEPHNFKGGSAPQKSGAEERSGSPVSSCVSFKSDQSMVEPHNFKGGSAPQKRTEERSTSPVSSSVSVTTNRSLPEPPNLEGSVPQESGTKERAKSPVSSHVSLKSDRSLSEPPNFKGGSTPQENETNGRSNPRIPNFVSLKSARSLPEPPNIQEGSASLKRDKEKTSNSESSHQPLKKDQENDSPPKPRDQPGSQSTVTSDKLQKKMTYLFNIFNELEKKIIALVKHELDIYKKILRNENTTYYRKAKQSKLKMESKWNLRHGVLNMTLSYLKKMEHEDLADALQNELIGIIQRPLKEDLIKKFDRVCEGIPKQGESTSLNTIYTDLYITEGGAGQVNKEHEVRLIEKTSVTRHTNQMEQEVQIKCKDMFVSEEDKPIRTVLTQGVAGIGKSISVQKFILDWAEGKEYQDIQFIFPLPFRELNLKKKECQSLMKTINLFFPETQGLRLTDQNKVLFILDGLDECQLPLEFQKNEILNNVTKAAPLDAVMTNLIKGNLLPSALIWITTRPAAASMIPAECIDRVTEVRGFNDEQKEEYFRKRISDQDLANKIIDHIRESRSLHIMCHIPVFCWISASVLQRILEETASEDTPKTLTQMYTCFLIFQTVQGNAKYIGKNALDIPWDEEGIRSLGKLAFQHLEKNSLIFYSSDLEACEISLSNISVYSGLCTQETVRFHDTVFSFVHLSIQEFLAAVFAYISLKNGTKNVLDHQSESQESKKTEVIDLLKTAVDKALKSDHGHLDLFLRFLLGLSLESNEKLIRGLLTQTGSRSDCQKDIVEYIKLKFKENPSPERSVNLFYCLNELNDDSLVKEIQSYMSSGRLSEAELSPAQWSALVFVLLTSKEKLEVFELKKFIRSDECLNRLLLVVKEATSALLSDCNLTERSCSALIKVLSSESSKLTFLDLSRNPIQDRGVELLSEGLKNENCKLENLGLSCCSITEEGYAALALALKSNPSSLLIELDLRGNDPGDTGVKELTDLLEDPHCKLKTLRLLSPAAEEVCDSLTKTLGINPLLQRELDLSGKIQDDSEMKKISDLLEDLHCRTQKLKLNNNSITEKGCAALSSALCSNPSHLIELDLSENKLGNSGVNQICSLLKNSNCTLAKLNLSFCSITEEGCPFLSSAFCSNPSHLLELDLSKNKLESSGVRQICSLLNNQHCKLQKLGLSDCSITEKGYADLASALKSNPSSYLIELDLRGNYPGDTGVELIIDLLKDPNCKLKARFLKTAAEKACDSLTEALGKNPLLLKELHLSGKIQGDSEMKKISDLLKDSHCTTQKLKLNKCSITEEGCAALSSALCSNPSYLTELDLSENKLGNSGVKQICTLLNNQCCKLQKLKLTLCSITEEGYADLASALKSNSSSHLIELDLRGNDPGDTGVKKLTDLQKDLKCKLTLRFLNTPDAEKACDSLIKVLEINPLLLRELDLSGKIQGDSELQLLCSLLEDSHCKIQELSLSKCNITVESCAALASVLRLESSSVRKMDLSNNNLQDSGMLDLAGGLTNPKCNLKIIILKTCALTEGSCSALANVLNSKDAHLSELDLSNNNLEDSGVMQLCAGLKNPQSALEIMRLSKCNIGEEGCCALASALKLNPSHLMELDLSGNKVGNSGVKQLSDLLKNSNCLVQKLKVSDNNVKGEGYAALASALKSNPSSHLIELDLRGNDPGDKGVKLLIDLQKDPKYKLQTLRLLKCSAAEDICNSLTKTLGKNPLLLRELDLSGKIQGDSHMKQISHLLEDSHCRTQKLKMNKSSITEEGCAALSSALCSNPSHLIELDLSDSKLGGSGLEKICGVLRNKQFKLLKLQ